MSNKKIRILQVNKSYFPVIGGIERVVQQIAEGLKSETDMKVLVCNDKPRTVNEKINGVDVCRCASIWKIGNIPIPFFFTKQLKKLGVDREVLLVHMPFPFSDLACLLAGFKGKIVVWWHSDVVRQKTMMVLYKPIMKLFLKRADLIIVATEGHINGSKYLGEYRDKCVVVPFGVEKSIEQRADLYVNKKSDVDDADRQTRFLFAGRIVYYKGCDILVKAFEKVHNAELVIVGSGDKEEEIKEYIEQKALTDKIHLLGHVSDDELSGLFSECDVFVLPSVERSEAFGLVQIEAMVYGKPVINTSLASGVPYVSLDKVTGLTVSPGNVDELAEAMQWMTDHPEERKQMGQNARNRVKKEYTIEKMLNSLEERLKEVIKEKDE